MIPGTAKAHRPAYGSDGDYTRKPSVEDPAGAGQVVVGKVIGVAREKNWTSIVKKANA